MTDQIELRGLRVTTIVGVNPEEARSRAATRARPGRRDGPAGRWTIRPSQRHDRLRGADPGRGHGSRRATAPLLLGHMAETVAAAVLAFDRRIEGVRVTVRKLRPPIPVDVATAAVTSARRRWRGRCWRWAPIAGTDPPTARRGVAAGPGGGLPVYETEPIGGPDDQRPYLNLVVRLETQRSARELLELCHALEAAADRVREVRWGPRSTSMCSGSMVKRSTSRISSFLIPGCSSAPSCSHRCPTSHRTWRHQAGTHSSPPLASTSSSWPICIRAPRTTPGYRKRPMTGRGKRVLVTGMGSELGSHVAARLEAEAWVGDIAGLDVDPRADSSGATFHRLEPLDRRRTVDVISQFDPRRRPSRRVGAEREPARPPRRAGPPPRPSTCWVQRPVAAPSDRRAVRHQRLRPPARVADPPGRKRAPRPDVVLRTQLARAGGRRTQPPRRVYQSRSCAWPRCSAPTCPARSGASCACRSSRWASSPTRRSVCSVTGRGSGRRGRDPAPPDGPVSVVADGAVTASQAARIGSRWPIPLVGFEWVVAKAMPPPSAPRFRITCWKSSTAVRPPTDPVPKRCSA